LAGTDAASTLRRLAEAPGAGLVASFVKEAWWRFGDARLSRPVMIEIGAGGGWNLARLPREWKRIGYDVDERFLVAGRAAFGVELRRGFIDEALEKLHEADCVLLSHVLEHVPDPVTTLRTIAAAARPDALLLIEVPGIFRLHRTSLDPMRYWQNAHTYTFCAKTLVSTCRRAGLEPLQVDEWIRLVLRPSAVTSRAVANDAKMARSIAGYLHYCELSHRLRQACSRLPLGAAAATWLAGRSADAIMRIWIALGLVRGARAGRTGLTI
jgi:SAM-dependent methyltransferase